MIMKEVTKEEFFKRIKDEKLDLVVSCVGNHPFTNEFKFRSGIVWGKVVPSEIEKKKGNYPYYVDHYYIM